MSTPGGLPRVLGLWTAVAVVIGTVIGSGVFKKATQVAGNVPEFAPAMGAWVLVGLLTLIGALILAEVASIVAKAGGNYAILRDSYGRWAGFLWGWVEFWIIRSASIGALATVFSEALHDILKQLIGDGRTILSPTALSAVTAGVIAVPAIVNARGTRLGGGLQVLVTTVKVISLVTIAVLPWVIWTCVAEPRAVPSTENLRPLVPADWSTFNWSKFGGALVGVFWAYHGWMNIAPIAEEIRDPQRNIPRSLLIGVGTIILLYLSVNLAYYLIIPNGQIGAIQGRTVAGEFSFRLLGSIGLLFTSTAVMVSVFGSLNGNLLVGPRLLYAMAHDRLAPRFLGELHPRYQTPARAEAVLAGWSIVMVIVISLLTAYRLPVVSLGGLGSVDLNLPEGKSPFDVITDFAMFGALSFETLAVASIFVLRRRFPRSTTVLPYRCPWYPVLPVIYVAALSAVLANMFRSQPNEAVTGLGFIAVGGAVYFAFLRRRKPASTE